MFHPAFSFVWLCIYQQDRVLQIKQNYYKIDSYLKFLNLAVPYPIAHNPIRRLKKSLSTLW